jgi:hypothetical protein
MTTATEVLQTPIGRDADRAGVGAPRVPTAD